MDSLLAYLLYRSAQSMMPESMRLAMTVFVLWLLFTKTVKLLPHFYRYPGDIKFIPLVIGFGYFHGLIKAYSLMTLHHVSLLGLVINKTHDNRFLRPHGVAAQPRLAKRARRY